MRCSRSIVPILVAVASLAFAGTSVAAPGFSQGFETDNSGWTLTNRQAVRVASGTNGVPSASGSFHAESNLTNATSAAGNLGGYVCCFPPTGFTISVDVYLDFSLADGGDRRFNYTVAINNSTDCTHLSDFVVALGTRPGIPGQWIASASQNCPGWPSDPGRTPQAITTGTGWYTMKYIFTNEAGFLDVDVEIKNSSAVVVAYFDVPTLYNPGSGTTPIPSSAVGGHRYAWFCSPASGSGYSALPYIAFDNSSVSTDECAVPAPSTSWGSVKATYR